MKKKLLICIILILQCLLAGYGSSDKTDSEFIAVPEPVSSRDYTIIVLRDDTAEITRHSGREIDIDIPSVLDGKKVTRIGKKHLICFDMYRDMASVTTIHGSIRNISDHTFLPA